MEDRVPTLLAAKEIRMVGRTFKMDYDENQWKEW